jgi:polar amino acid transport system substrate-binding protein
MGISPIFAGEIEVVVLVNDTHPPYAYLENGEAKGIYIEVMKKISLRMEGYSIQFKPAPWPRVKEEIKNGRAFSFVGPYYHGHDWLYVWPYSLPIMDESVVVVCRDEVLKTPRSHWPDDYLGLIIGNNTGYDGFGGVKFRDYVREGKITLQEVKTTRQNILMLISGRADCYMVNRLSYSWEMKQLIEAGQTKLYPKFLLTESLVISTDAVYMGFTDTDEGKYPFKKDFHQKFNNELYSMYKSNEIERITKEYIKKFISVAE